MSPSAISVEHRLLQARRWIDEAFTEHLNRFGWHEQLRTLSSHVLIGGGKALRPALLFWAASDASSERPRSGALSCGLALEMIHTYSLVHDDLPCMDDDDFRRGRPTLHRLAGEAMAVLTGDALLTGAFEVIAAAELEAPLRAAVCGEFARAAGGAGMIAGQVLDLEGTGAGVTTEEALFRLHHLKTGALFGTACAVGSSLSESAQNPSRAESARKWGMELGLLFQIVDDLLDQAEGTGKSRGKDERQHKTTSVSLWGLEGAKARAQRMSEELVASATTWGASRDDAQAWIDFVRDRAF